MTDGPEVPLSERLRARHVDPDAQAVLATLIAGVPFLGLGILIPIGWGLAKGWSSPVELIILAGGQFFAICVSLLFVIHAMFSPSHKLGRWAAGRFQEGKPVAEVVWMVLFLGLICQVWHRLAVVIFSHQLRPDHVPGWLEVVISGLIMWLILMPFQMLFWWAGRAAMLGYNLSGMFNPRNAKEQWRKLFASR